MMKATAVEIEVDGPHNECLGFRPLQRSIRGRFDMMRIGEPMARVKATDWPIPIPSQRLGIDPDGRGYLIEPLHEPQFTPLREKIAKLDLGTLEPQIQEFADVDLPTWYFWLQQAVDAGLAKIVSGILPTKLDGPVRKNFLTAEAEPSTVDKLTSALDRQSALFERLLERLGSK